ncbi:metallo-beta-lactamase domain-containing protein 1 [Struthio camelus]|uniref:metallo-beta-lactamase domain-containing protein 1 n=1 Tax=Struthio camelus TaxID=8801 RepID=UPI0036041407
MNKGVKVDLGVPVELWDKSSAEVTQLKQQMAAHTATFRREPRPFRGSGARSCLGRPDSVTSATSTPHRPSSPPPQTGAAMLPGVRTASLGTHEVPGTPYSVRVLQEGYSQARPDGSLLADGSITLVRGPLTALVDTGGPWNRERLPALLAAQGLSPADVTHVLCTHGHSDHVGAPMSPERDGSVTALLQGRDEAPKRPVMAWLGKLLVLVLSVTIIVIGALHVGQCPAQPLLPHYLLVAGTAALLALALGWPGRAEAAPGARGARAILLLFLFAWFIAGSAWVYGAYPPESRDAGSARYCHPRLYACAFWLTSAGHAVAAGALLAAAAILAGLRLLRAAARRRPPAGGDVGTQ